MNAFEKKIYILEKKCWKLYAKIGTFIAYGNLDNIPYDEATSIELWSKFMGV